MKSKIKVRATLKKGLKKQTHKKTFKKGAEPSVRASNRSSSRSICREIQKGVDAALLSLPPKVQANIDQVLKTIDTGPFRLQDLRALGYRVLQHATEISSEISGAMKATHIISRKQRKPRG